MTPLEQWAARFSHVKARRLYRIWRNTPNCGSFEHWLNAQPPLVLLLWGFDV